MTAYQKLKAENERLKSDLREVCLNPDSGKASMIKIKYKILRDLTNAIMAGEPDINRMEYKGIIPQMEMIKDDTKGKVNKPYEVTFNLGNMPDVLFNGALVSPEVKQRINRIVNSKAK